MRCLIIVPSLLRAGAETQAVDLANGLSSIGHEVHLCSFDPALDQRDRLHDEVRFHHIQRKWKYDWSLVTRLADLIDREDIDVLQGVLQFAVLIAWLAARRSVRKPPVVAAIHTTINRGLKEELHERVIYRRILRRTDALVFVCDYQRQYWLNKYPYLRQLSHVVHNGVDPGRFQRHEHISAAHMLRSKLGIPTTAFVFGCVAAFRPEKGHKLLMQAFAQLPPDTYLILAGDGGERANIERVVQTLKLEKRVHLLGTLSDVRPVIVAVNATVLASTAVETFSMAMLESMALEVPVVAPRIGGLGEAIQDGENGYLFPVGDVASLEHCMRQLLSSCEKTESMGHKAARTIRDVFTLKKMIDGSETVLEDAIHSSR